MRISKESQLCPIGDFDVRDLEVQLKITCRDVLDIAERSTNVKMTLYRVEMRWRRD